MMKTRTITVRLKFNPRKAGGDMTEAELAGWLADLLDFADGLDVQTVMDRGDPLAFVRKLAEDETREDRWRKMTKREREDSNYDDLDDYLSDTDDDTLLSAIADYEDAIKTARTFTRRQKGA
jgi:hypothetical protein